MLLKCCFTSIETIRLIRDGEKGGRGYRDGGRGRLYTYCYTVTARMTPALRWAAMRAILMFHNCEGQSHTDHSFGRERRTEADSNRGPSAYQPNALPLRQTGSRQIRSKRRLFELTWRKHPLVQRVANAEWVVT